MKTAAFIAFAVLAVTLIARAQTTNVADASGNPVGVSAASKVGADMISGAAR